MTYNITLKGRDLSPRYFFINDPIYGPLGAFFFSTVMWKSSINQFLAAVALGYIRTWC